MEYVIQGDLHDSAPRLINRSHLSVCGEERTEYVCGGEKGEKQRGLSSRWTKQKISSNDVVGFPLSNTKLCTVYHGFQRVCLKQTPLQSSPFQWTLPTTLSFGAVAREVMSAIRAQWGGQQHRCTETQSI